MATQWQTFPIEFKGGLISNMSLLQQGTNAVGSAQTLTNFEVSEPSFDCFFKSANDIWITSD